MENNFTLEICCDSVAAAVTAQQAGSRRIELCADLPHGGTTPSYGMIKTVREQLDIDVFVLIRPRSGGFFYNPDEFNTIMEDIRICGELGCDGVVTGVLGSDGTTVDTARSAELASLAHSLSMKATFHRAFDCCANMLEELEKVIETGYDRILTSGGAPTAAEGADMISRLVKAADGRIVIMPGSGVRPGNIGSLAGLTGAKEFHGSFQVRRKTPEMSPALKAITGDYIVMETDAGQIRQAIETLKSL